MKRLKKSIIVLASLLLVLVTLNACEGKNTFDKSSSETEALNSGRDVREELAAEGLREAKADIDRISDIRGQFESWISVAQV